MTSRGASLHGPIARGELPVFPISNPESPPVGHRPYDQLKRCWHDAQNGARKVALIRGPEGVGKTRLAHDFADYAYGSGGRVLYGRSTSAEWFAPLAEALSDHFRGLDDGSVRRAVGAQNSEVVRLIPGLRARWGRQVMPAPSEHDERHGVFDDVSRTLASLSHATPTTVILDDVHDMGHAGLALLKHILRDNQHTALFVLLLSRTWGGSPFEKALPELSRDVYIEEAELSSLNRAEADRLALHLDGRPLSRTEWKASKGNPLNIENTVALRGASVSHGAGRPSVRALAGLTDSERVLVELLMLVPDDLGTTVLAKITATAAADVRSVLHQLEERSLFVASVQDTDSWRLRHRGSSHSIREAIASRHGDELARYAGKLAQHLAEEADPHPAIVASLYETAEDLESARQWSERAATQALEHRAFEEAASHHAKALEHCDSLGFDTSRSCGLANEVGAELWKAGRFREARLAYRDAADRAHREEDWLAFVDAALGLSGRVGFQGPSDDKNLVDTLRKALEVTPAESMTRRARILAALAHAVTFRPSEPPPEDRCEPQGLAQAAYEIALGTKDEQLLADVLCTTGWAIWTPDNLEERMARAEHAVRLADGLRHEVLQMESRLFRITCLLETGEVRDAQKDAQKLRTLATEVRNPYYTAIAAQVGACFALLEDPHGGETAVREALELAQRDQNPALSRVFATQIFYPQMFNGKLDEVRASAWDLTRLDPGIPGWRSGLALILSDNGRSAAARRELRRLVADDCASVPRDMFWLLAIDNLARVCVDVGDEACAQALYDALAPYDDRLSVACGGAAIHGPVALELGLLADLLGRREDADRYMDRAREMSLAIGSTASIAETEVEAARVKARRLVNSTKADVTRDTARQCCRAADLVCDVASARMARRLLTTIGTINSVDAKMREDLHDAALRLARVAFPVQPRPKRKKRVRTAVVRPLVRPLGWVRGAWMDKVIERCLAPIAVQRCVMMLMEWMFQADVAYPFEGEVVLQLVRSNPRERPGTWILTIHKAGIRIRDGAQTRPAPGEDRVVVRLSMPELVRLVGGGNGVGAWFDGRVAVHGDPLVAGRLVEMFVGPRGRR